MAGRRIGRYEIVQELGRGATASVYLARHALLGKEVALKELYRQQAADPIVAERFLREAQLASSLVHPNIVTIYDYFPHRGLPYIAMEYLERGSLRPLIGRLDSDEIITVLQGLLAGLAYAEAKTVVHRDLKPENLMLTDTGSIKITDFGIAKAYGPDDKGKLTQTGTVVGAPAYMSPEQATGRDAGPLADLYAVGVIAYELVTGVVPFLDDEPMTILYKHVHEPVVPVRAHRADVDDRLAEWIERLLAKDPRDRPQSAAVAWEELEPVVEDLRPRRRQAPAAPVPKASVSPWRAVLHPLNVVVPLVVLGIGIAIGAFWLVPVALAVYGALVFISLRESSGSAGLGKGPGSAPEAKGGTRS